MTKTKVLRKLQWRQNFADTKKIMHKKKMFNITCTQFLIHDLIFILSTYFVLVTSYVYLYVLKFHSIKTFKKKTHEIRYLTRTNAPLLILSQERMLSSESSSRRQADNEVLGSSVNGKYNTYCEGFFPLNTVEV